MSITDWFASNYVTIQGYRVPVASFEDLVLLIYSVLYVVLFFSSRYLAPCKLHLPLSIRYKSLFQDHPPDLDS